MEDVELDLGKGFEVSSLAVGLPARKPSVFLINRPKAKLTLQRKNRIYYDTTHWELHES